MNRKLHALLISVFSAILLSGCMSAGPLIRPGTSVGFLELANYTDRTIGAVALSDCSANTHGGNRLPDGELIESGTWFRFKVSAGCWDILGYTMGGGEFSGRAMVQADQISRFNIGEPPKK